MMNKDVINKIGKDKLLLMAIAGIVLILCSYMDFSGDNSKKNNTTVDETIVNNTDVDSDEYVALLEKRLETLVRNVHGAGECQVMITVKGTKEKILQSDSDARNKSESGQNNINESEISENTVVLQGEEEEYPYVVKEIMPEIEGVVVVAKGAENKKVNADIIKIVQALFNVETHKISIIEMK